MCSKIRFTKLKQQQQQATILSRQTRNQTRYKFDANEMKTSPCRLSSAYMQIWMCRTKPNQRRAMCFAFAQPILLPLDVCRWYFAARTRGVLGKLIGAHKHTNTYRILDLLLICSVYISSFRNRLALETNDKCAQQQQKSKSTQNNTRDGAEHIRLSTRRHTASLYVWPQQRFSDDSSICFFYPGSARAQHICIWS